MRLASVAEHKDIFKFLTDLIMSPSCRDRECFIKLIPTLVRIYSKKFFKKHFYDSVLYLSKDKVPNIRYQICSILPQIKECWHMIWFVWNSSFGLNQLKDFISTEKADVNTSWWSRKIEKLGWNIEKYHFLWIRPRCSKSKLESRSVTFSMRAFLLGIIDMLCWF